LQNAFPASEWIQALPEKFWLNGVHMAFIASLSATLTYVVVSLLSPDPQLDMDKLLHRGAYQVKAPEGADHFAPVQTGWRGLLPGAEFTRGDRIIYYLKLGWVAFFFLSFISICIWQLFYKWPDRWWANWWLINLILTGVTGTLTTIWFLIGGYFDLKAMFARLSTIQRNSEDDGTVD